MKTLAKFLKTGMLIAVAAVALSACNKDDEDPASIYTPEREAGLIKEWLDEMVKNNNDIDTTSTGIFYVLDKEGTGPTVQTGDTVTVKYTGYFMDGTVFDSSAYRGDGTMTYVHKDSNPNKRLIQGWEEGIEVLNKGSKAVILIPSAKGYGPYGYGPIPPYTPLIFVIEVVDIK